MVIVTVPDVPPPVIPVPAVIPFISAAKLSASVLKNLDQIYEQGQAVNLKDVGWYDDFLKKNDLSTEGILLPAGELNFMVGGGGGYKVQKIGNPTSDGRVLLNEITGIGKVGDQYVYTTDVTKVDATDASGYYDQSGMGQAQWTKDAVVDAMRALPDRMIAIKARENEMLSESNLIDQVRHDVGLPAFAVKIAVNIDGTYPAFAIWIMIRLARSVSGITDPTVRSSISTWESIVYLLA